MICRFSDKKRSPGFQGSTARFLSESDLRVDGPKHEITPFDLARYPRYRFEMPETHPHFAC